MSPIKPRQYSRPLALAVLLLATASILLPASATATWDTDFGQPGVDGSVSASVVYAGHLIIGGNFTTVGAVQAGNLARWDGAQWQPMGSPFADEVLALQVWNGELYAGGSFTPYLVRWDGTDWVAVGGGLAGPVNDLTVWNGNLAVAGNFEGAGGGTASPYGVTVWDGSTWAELEGGIFGDVAAIEAYAGSLYVTGSFDSAGFTYAENLARWDGNTWHEVGGGLTDGDFDPYNAYGFDLAVYDGELFVAGGFERAGVLSAEGLVAWNGTSFSIPGSPPLSGEVSGLGLFGSDLVVGDVYGIVQRWNGTYWATLGIPDGPVVTFTELEGELFAGGYFVKVGEQLAPGLARYDGSWWATAQGQGGDDDVQVIFDWNGTPVAGGDFSRLGEVSSRIAAWDGTAWQPLGDGIPVAWGSRVTSLVSFEGDLIVGGAFSTAGGVAANKIARWDGSQWSAMGTGSAGGIRGLLVLDDQLYATGYWSGEQTLGLWNGSDFDPLGTGISGSVQLLNCVAAFQGDPVVGGAFTSIDGVSANFIARWDGAAWQPLGGGTSGYVHAVHEMNGLLYVGGSFTTAGGVPATNVAVWDGSQWSAMGDGLYGGRVYDITSLGSTIYATGDFTSSGGQPVRHVARWNGTTWEELETGLDDGGRTLATIDGKIWVGGEFSKAGSVASAHVGCWQPDTASAVPGVALLAGAELQPAWPNPFNPVTTLRFNLPHRGHVSLKVFDLRGRCTATLADGVLEAGSHARDWRPRRAASGVYLAQLLFEGQSVQTVRMTLLK